MFGQKNWNQFLQILQQDRQAQDSLKKATDQEGFVNLAVQLGKQKGFNFTSKDLKAMLAQALAPISEELSDDELACVAGGGDNDDKPKNTHKNCGVGGTCYNHTCCVTGDQAYTL